MVSHLGGIVEKDKPFTEPRRFPHLANRVTFGEYYGKERAQKVKFAEAFEICENGRRPDKEEIKRLLPFFTA